MAFNPQNLFDDEDLNGEIFYICAEGEALVPNSLCTVYYPVDFPMVDVAKTKNLATRQEIGAFLSLNILLYMERCADINLATSPTEAAAVSYLRYLSWRSGFSGCNLNVNDYHVTYNDAVAYPDCACVDVYDLINEQDEHGAFIHADKIAALNDLLTPVKKQYWKKRFANLVCAVAYMFRTRGHHYLQEMEAKYIALWKRALYVDGDLTLSWQRIAVHALHAIFPMILDNAWYYLTKNSFCAGTFVLRYHCAAAGTAAFFAASKGLSDVKLVFPYVTTICSDEEDYLRETIAEISDNRWNGSINSTYYGVSRKRYDETVVQVIGAIVRGIYTRLAELDPLNASAALTRLASHCPVTGSAIGVAAQRLSRLETFYAGLVSTHKMLKK